MDYHDPQTVRMAHIAANVIALVMLWCSWKKPAISRLLFFLLFLWASWVNSTTARNTPELYLEYADLSFLPFYKNFILGFFARNITPLVTAIAVCQFCIGIAMLLKGWIFRLGCIGGMVFLVSIAPFGVGSGFPSTLIMAAGLYLLLKKKLNAYWWEPFLAKN